MNKKSIWYSTPDALVSSVRLIEGPAHDRITVWCRGGCAGDLTFGLGAGREFVRRLGFTREPDLETEVVESEG